MNRHILFVPILFSSLYTSAQISGTVVDARTGEALSGAVALFGGHATVTNNYGFFSIANANATDSLRVSFLGYKPYLVLVDARKTHTIAVKMEEDAKSIGEVTAKASSIYKAEMASPVMSHHHVTQEQLRSVPMIFGEPDALKTLQLMPGVNSVADGSSNLSVRGGSHDQNLVILDEAPVYNPTHAIGMISAFNPDAVRSVDMFKSSLPARYGGRLTSVVDVRMKEGNNQKYEVNGAVGIINSRLAIEGPIKKDTSSFLVSGRAGYGKFFNKFAEMFNKRHHHDNDKLAFNDITAKVNRRMGNGDRLYLSAYMTNDNFHFNVIDNAAEIKWNNRTLTGRWNHIFSPTVFANTTVAASHYGYKQHHAYGSIVYDWTASMGEVDAKLDLDHTTSFAHLTYGADIQFHHYRPGKIAPINGKSMNTHDMGSRNMATAAAYLSAEKTFFDRLNISAGLRLSLNAQLGPVNTISYADAEREIPVDTTRTSRLNLAKAYFNPEPRLATSFVISEYLTLKASYTHTCQGQHLLSTSALSMPTDIWVPADTHIKPQTANSFAIGLHGIIPPLDIELSAEAYYRETKNLLDFKDGVDLKMNEFYEQATLQGRGRAKGVEFMLRKDARRFSLMTSYTLSVAKRQINGINDDRWYYDLFDQRHNFSFTGLVNITDRISLATTFNYHTGGRRTLPTSAVKLYGNTFGIYTERNGYTMPDFHRLDLSAHFKLRNHGRYHHSIDLSVINVYGRKNVFNVLVKPEVIQYWDNQDYKMMYLYRWVPSITYIFRF
ncbi:MAG: TonB-dependent receptor [Bacteroidales bacterium]|nr:TonB-dependent receptor [Bacteroidales bacterium]